MGRRSSVLLAVSGKQGIRGGRGGGSGNGEVEEVEAEAGKKTKRKKERKRLSTSTSPALIGTRNPEPSSFHQFVSQSSQPPASSLPPASLLRTYAKRYAMTHDINIYIIYYNIHLRG